MNCYTDMRLILPVLCLLLGACATRRPLPVSERVNLQDFMGAWFVVGYTPILVDHGAHNAVEQYVLDPKGRIQTTYQFRKGGFGGKLKTHTPTGSVPDPTRPAEWNMQFIWPFKADYRVLYLSEDGQHTIIAHPNRKYAWIMQRTPRVNAEAYDDALRRLRDEGFDLSSIQRVPQDWSHEPERLKKIEAAGNSRRLSEL